MKPGAWYARSDLRHLAHLSESEIVGVRIFSHGYLSRLLIWNMKQSPRRSISIR
jgi:hypothetical protein